MLSVRILALPLVGSIFGSFMKGGKYIYQASRLVTDTRTLGKMLQQDGVFASIESMNHKIGDSVSLFVSDNSGKLDIGGFKSGSKPEHMTGENGTQTSSKTTWKNGKTERIDIENKVFYDQKTGNLALKSVQKLLQDKNFMKGIQKALEILGE